MRRSYVGKMLILHEFFQLPFEGGHHGTHSYLEKVVNYKDFVEILIIKFFLSGLGYT